MEIEFQLTGYFVREEWAGGKIVVGLLGVLIPVRSAVGRQKGGYPESSIGNADTSRIETRRTDGMVSLPPESSSSPRPRVQLS